MKKVRLFIADMDLRFVASVREAIHRRTDLELIGNSCNGRQALAEIRRLSPDVVLTDIPLPELDGIALLRELRRSSHAPAVIVCTRFYSQASIHCASRFGASFFLCKPVDIQALCSRIVECANCPAPAFDYTEEDEEQASIARRARIARNLMKEFGLPARLNGSAYILEAVLYCADDGLLKNLTRGLYAELARRMNATPSRVERSMRNAIQIACERGSLLKHFPGKPSNREFIVFLINAVNSAEREQR